MHGLPSFAGVSAILIVSHSIALITTGFRLWHRKLSSQLWWDDFWALVALTCDTFLWIVTIVAPMGSPTHMSHSMRTFAKLGALSAYTTALWASRISIAVTIVRLLNPGKFRSIAKAVTMFFGLFWLTLVIQKIFPCGIKTPALNWCPIPRVTGYIELGTDVLADTWLVLAPFYMVWKMKMSHSHRRLVIAIFACSLLTIGSCVAHIYFILAASPVWTGITAHIQTGVSIVVCNMLVLVTYVYRAFFKVRMPAETTTTQFESAPQNGNSHDRPSGLGLEKSAEEIPRRSWTERDLRSQGSSNGCTQSSFLISTPLVSQWSTDISLQSSRDPEALSPYSNRSNGIGIRTY